MNRDSSGGRAPAGSTRPVDAAIAVTVLAILLTWLGRGELLGYDEARHTEIGRAMLASGSFLVPHLDGEPYYDKPAAYYWLVAASLRTFGHNEFAARLPSVLAALVTIAAAARFAARAYGPSTARLTAIALATTPVFVALGRYGLLDMTLTATLTIAFTSLGIWWIDRSVRMPVLFYAAIGAATLVKGPVALAQATIALGCLYFASTRDRSRSPTRMLRALSPLRGLLIAAAVALPWYIAAWLADPDYIRTFLFSHNIERFAGAGPGSTHVEPWWYYPVLLPLMLLPWTPWVAAGLARLHRKVGHDDADLYCLVWTVSTASVYLAAGSKLATYMLPTVVPLICFAASAVDSEFHRVGGALVRSGRAARRWALGVTAFASTCAMISCVYIWAEHPHAVGRIWTLAPALLALPLALVLPRSPTPQRWMAATALAATGLTLAAYGAATDVVAGFKDMRTLAAVIDTQLPAGARLFTFRAPAHAATFYNGRVMRTLVDPDEARELIESDAATALVIRRRDIALLGAPLPPGVEPRWSNRGGMVLLVNARAAVPDSAVSPSPMRANDAP